jgi:hypothetical protein
VPWLWRFVTLLMTPVASLGALRIDEKPTNLRALDVLDKLARNGVPPRGSGAQGRSLASTV